MIPRIQILYRIIFSDRLIFEPNERIRNTFYKCDSKFYLDEILIMYIDHDVNGIIYTDGNYCNWYALKNKDLKKISSKTVILQNQFAGGGQSQNRLARLRDIQREQNITALAERTVELFYDKKENCQKMVNIVFCGPAEFKTELSEYKLIKQFFTNVHVVTMADMNYDLLLETIEKFDDPTERMIVDTILYMIETADSKLVFGNDIQPAIESCELKTLYIHKNNDYWGNYEPNYKLEIIKISSDVINTYGGVLGVKFY